MQFRIHHTHVTACQFRCKQPPTPSFGTTKTAHFLTILQHSCTPKTATLSPSSTDLCSRPVVPQEYPSTSRRIGTRSARARRSGTSTLERFLVRLRSCLIYSFTHSLSPAFSHSLIHVFPHSLSLHHSITHSLVLSSIHSLIHSCTQFTCSHPFTQVMAHAQAGQCVRALQLMRLQWGYMLNHPNSTQSSFWEGYHNDGSFAYQGALSCLFCFAACCCRWPQRSTL